MRWRFLVAAGVLSSLFFSVAAAGLTQVTIDRDVTASVVADNSTAAVKLECIDNSGSGGKNYQPICEYDANGVVSLNLKKGIDTSGNYAFNSSAIFVIGKKDNNFRVFRVTNNSGITIKVWLEPNGSWPTGSAVRMYDQTDTEATLASPKVLNTGQSHEFYFKVETTGTAAGNSVSAKLKVREQ